MDSEIGRDRLEQMLHWVSQGVICQDAGGQVSFINQKAREVFGPDAEKALASDSAARRWRLICEDGSVCPDEEAPSSITLRTGRTLRGQILGVLWEDRPVTWISMNTSPIFGADPETPEAVVIIFTDITKQKLDDELQRNSYRRQQIAMDLAKPVHWEYEVDADLFTFDERFYALYGTSSSGQGGNLLSSREYASRFLPPEEIPVVAGEIEAALETTDPEFTRQLEHRIIGADGQVRHLLVRYGIVKDDAGRTIRLFGANQDITARKTAEERLRVSEEKFRGIFTHSNVGIALADGEGRILGANQAFRDLAGQEEPELVGRSFREITHPDDLEQEEALLARLMAGEIDSYRMEKRYIDRAGTRPWMDLSVAAIRGRDGRPESFVGVVVDISEKLRAREALSKAEERYRTLFEVSPDGILIIAPQTSLPLQFNRAAHENLGYSREEFKGLRIWDYEEQEDPDEVRRRIAMILETGRDDFETRHRRKDGDVRDVLVTVQIVDIGGQAEFLTVFRDITRIRRAEEGVRDLSSRLLLATRAGNIGVWEWDVDGGTLTWNQQMYDLYGMEPDGSSSLYQAWRDRMHPEDLERVESLMKVTLAGGGDYEAEFRIVRPDGQVRHLKAAATLTGQGQESGRRVIGVNWDVTKQKEAEERLREARSHAYDILESTTDAFFELDADFNLTYINSRAERTMGLDSGEYLGANLWELFPEARDTEFHRQYRRALAEQKVVSFEAYYAPLDSWTEVWAYPTPNSLSVYFHDVTERKRLQQERDRIFELSLDMICLAGFDGYFKELNPSWERILGWSREELMALPWLELVHPEDLQSVTQAGRSLADGRTITSFENRYRCKDGSYRWISWNAYPVTDQSMFVAVVRDVTENRKVREILRRDRDELEQRVRQRTEDLAAANRDLLSAKEAAEAANRVKTEFLANVSHELRTPLNPIVSMADFLEETDLTDEQKGFMKDIRDSAGRLLEIIDRLIELTSIESRGLEPNIQPFSLSELLEGALREHQPRARAKGLTLESRLAGDAPEVVEADPSLLNRVLSMLLENAVKFTEQGGVSLGAALGEDEKGQAILRLTVADSGPGLPPEAVEGLFADFTQADGSLTRRHGGLGLGLTLARRVVAGLGGRLRAENLPQGGCAFHLEFPNGGFCRW